MLVRRQGGILRSKIVPQKRIIDFCQEDCTEDIVWGITQHTQCPRSLILQLTITPNPPQFRKYQFIGRRSHLVKHIDSTFHVQTFHPLLHNPIIHNQRIQRSSKKLKTTEHIIQNIPSIRPPRSEEVRYKPSPFKPTESTVAKRPAESALTKPDSA